VAYSWGRSARWGPRRLCGINRQDRRCGDGPSSWLASWARRYAMAIGSSGSFGLVAAGGHPLPEMPKTIVRREVGGPRAFVRRCGCARPAAVSTGRWLGRRCGWRRFRLFDDKPGVHHSLEGEHVHALRSRERGCFLVVQNSMGGKNSVNNRCRIAKHFQPKMKSKLRLFHRHFFAFRV
jgi:hypothetical protein